MLDITSVMNNDAAIKYGTLLMLFAFIWWINSRLDEIVELLKNKK